MQDALSPGRWSYKIQAGDAMTDQQDQELKKELDKIDWQKHLDYGSVKIQIRNGKPTLVTIERTIRLDGESPSKPEITTRAPVRIVR